MGKELTKVIYQPDSTSTEVFQIFINEEEFKKYKTDKTIPLLEVVDSFEIFHSATGVTGQLGKASKSQLENAFGTAKDVDVIQQMLEKGQMQEGHKISGRYTDSNDSRGVNSGGGR